MRCRASLHDARSKPRGSHGGTRWELLWRFFLTRGRGISSLHCRHKGKAVQCMRCFHPASALPASSEPHGLPACICRTHSCRVQPAPAPPCGSGGPKLQQEARTQGTGCRGGRQARAEVLGCSLALPQWQCSCRSRSANASCGVPWPAPVPRTPPPAGGLGDVMSALPKALARRGHRVMVVVPRYANYPDAWETGSRKQMSVFGATQEVGLRGGRGRARGLLLVLR